MNYDVFRRMIAAAGVLALSTLAVAPAARAETSAPETWPGKSIVAGDTGIQMQWIAPGTFWMGDSREGMVTTVHITRGYWLGKYVVTQGQWQALLGGNPSHFKEMGKNAPVENVSWDDATDFCWRINERERSLGRLPAGYEYRLPTEAEWEYACRAGTTGDFGGDGAIDDMGWYADNSDQHTQAVGQKQANAWGLYDMHGDVWEWCSDWYGPYAGGVATDPTGPKSGTSRVYRGGCWFIVAEHCRSAFRFDGLPELRDNYLGFRLALAPKIP
jgi:formylglycine-generating enzyme required for sulfatase activity